MEKTRVALVVNVVTTDLAGNLSALIDAAYESAAKGARLTLFPEAALTGLSLCGVPARDLPYGQPVPGPVTDAFAALARETEMWVATGLLEREGDEIYDCAILAAPDGRIALKYRRISRGWQGRRADRSIYKQGLDLPCAPTALGSTALVISGDLYDDDVFCRLQQARPECVLAPFSRPSDDHSDDRERWDKEVEACAARAAMLGSPTLVTSYLAGPEISEADSSVGGAAAIDADGTVLGSLPVGEPGVLVVDVPSTRADASSTQTS